MGPSELMHVTYWLSSLEQIVLASWVNSLCIPKNEDAASLLQRAVKEN